MKLSPVVVRSGIVLALGLLIIGFTAWRTYPRITKGSLLDPNLKYMHCPECGTETKFDLNSVDKPCLECSYDKGLVPTVESIKAQTAKSPYGRMVALLLPEFIVLLAALWYVLKPPAVPVENYRYLRCPNCGQKLRYRAAQVGALGACSRCKKPMRFPEGTTNEKELDGGTAEELVPREEDEE